MTNTNPVNQDVKQLSPLDRLRKKAKDHRCRLEFGKRTIEIKGDADHVWQTTASHNLFYDLDDFGSFDDACRFALSEMEAGRYKLAPGRYRAVRAKR